MIGDQKRTGYYIFKRDGEEVGRIKFAAIEGWWVEDDAPFA